MEPHGTGLPSAMMMTAAMMYPDSRVLAVCGDGRFMMNSQEMETAVRLHLSLVVPILNDGACGMIRVGSRRWTVSPDYGLNFGNSDVVRTPSPMPPRAPGSKAPKD